MSGFFGGGSISTDPFAPIGDIDLHDDKTVWLIDAKTRGIRFNSTVGDIVFIAPANDSVLGFYEGFRLEANTAADGTGTFLPTIWGRKTSQGAYVEIGVSPTAGLRITADGQGGGVGLPTTTDPNIVGALFTCTASELASLLAAGAKHILLSKGV